jgi:hypothetical protein
LVDSPTFYESLCNLYEEITSTSQDADTNFFKQEEKVDLSETGITGHDIGESFASPDERDWNQFSLYGVRYWCEGKVLGSPDGLRVAAGEDFLAYNSEELTDEDLEEAVDRMIERRETEIEELAYVEGRL